jgi:pectate lyase
VAGQTAPGDGITLKNYPLVIRNANNIVLRFIRSRMGDLTNIEGDALTVRKDSEGVSPENIIIDHCSFSWGTDETMSIVNSKNITLQNCIISEGLHDSVHGKGPHGYGGIVSGQNISVFHNLITHFKERNLQFQKGDD